VIVHNLHFAHAPANVLHDPRIAFIPRDVYLNNLIAPADIAWNNIPVEHRLHITAATTRAQVVDRLAAMMQLMKPPEPMSPALLAAILQAVQAAALANGVGVAAQAAIALSVTTAINALPVHAERMTAPVAPGVPVAAPLPADSVIQSLLSHTVVTRQDPYYMAAFCGTASHELTTITHDTDPAAIVQTIRTNIANYA
jgi:hypothetical protein